MYYRPTDKKRKQRMRAVRILVFTLAFLLLLFGIDRKIRPIIRSNAVIQAKIISVRALNEAVSEKLKDTQNGCNQLVHIAKDADGKVTSIDTDTAMISKIQTELTKSVMENLKKLKEAPYAIHIGTLISPEYFAGKGFRLHLKLMPSGYVTTKIVSSFSDAGINQTHHQITFKVSVPVYTAISGYRSVMTIDTDFILADTIIVGEVPEYYTNVVTEDKNLVNDINDYSTNNLPAAGK